MKSIFDLCVPRKDVAEGRVRDEEFAADLSRVVCGTAEPEYADPATFFKYTHPTRGLKALLEAVCRRLSGVGGEVSSVIRLDTQYGGGKTHSLIALVHAVRGMKGAAHPEEFVDPALLPAGNIRVAALDGERADPANGLKLEDGLLAHSLWGEMAYQLAGRAGYERVRKSDEQHVAPGEPTITELFGNEPTLILIDEVSVYLRKVAKAFPGAEDQFTAFIQALIKAVSSNPRVSLVTTLAVRAQDHKAADAYQDEQYVAMKAFSEAEAVIARKLMQLDPTEEDETVDVLRRRLFESVDLGGAAEVVAQYVDLWDRNRDSLAADAFSPEVRDQFRKGYPLHPELMTVMVEKMSSLQTFQRTRGMLRLLARTVHAIWKYHPVDAWAIHPHHIDLSLNPIRTEFLTRMNQGAYAPALSADVASVPGKDPSTAQQLDQKWYPGQAPVTAYVARTVFLNTMAFGDNAQGIEPDRVRYSVCSPSMEPALVEAARRKFVGESVYLDDRPGVPLRFRVEPNLLQIIRRVMNEVDPADLRATLNTKIKDLFSVPKGDFEVIAFPAGAYEVPDDLGDGRPYLVVLNYDAHYVSESATDLPKDLVLMATRKGQKEEPRRYQNNVVFVAADEKLVKDMKAAVQRRLALEALLNGPQLQDLAEYQQRKVKEEYEKSRTMVATAIMQAYRNLFFPSGLVSSSGEARLSHTVIELPSVSDSPGQGQLYVRRALKDQKKLLGPGDEPDAPTFVRDQTPMKVRGQISTAELREEFRRAPKLSILLDDSPLVRCIQKGIEQGIFIYRQGDLVWGKGDPAPAIQISDGAFVHTMENAKEQKLWPRAPKHPIRIRLREPTGGDKVQVEDADVLLVGTIASDVPVTATYRLEGRTSGSGKVDDIKASGEGEWIFHLPLEFSRGSTTVTLTARNEDESDTVTLAVHVGGGPVPVEGLTAQGPLKQALTELFEKARARKIGRLASLHVGFFDKGGFNTLHQGVGSLREVTISLELDASLAADGIDTFTVRYEGTADKANSLRSYLDPMFRTATENTCEGTYRMQFSSPLATDGASADAFISMLTKYGGAEAFVEAEAAPEK